MSKDYCKPPSFLVAKCKTTVYDTIMMMTMRMMALIIMVTDDGYKNNNDEKIRLMAEMMIFDDNEIKAVKC